MTPLKEPSGDRPDSEEAMRGTARLLADVAVKAFAESHCVDRETAERWILDAIVEMIEGTHGKS